MWSSKLPSLSPPAADKASIQKEWDNPQVLATLDHLLDSAPDEVCLARLTAVSALEAGASMAESKKASKYAHLFISHIFIPVAVESLGAFSSRSLSFIHTLGHKICQYSGNELATSYLLQRI